MLLVHGIGHGKKTSRRLPKSKILVVWEGGGCSNFFSIILIADLQGLEDVFGGPSFSGEILDVGINGGDGSNGGSGGCRGDRGFGVPDLLRAVISLGFSRGLRGATFVSAVSLFAASKADPSLMHQARSAGESFFKRIVSMSMASGSLVEHELEGNEKRGKPFPFLRALMRACCLWKSMAFSIQALRVVGTFSME